MRLGSFWSELQNALQRSVHGGEIEILGSVGDSPARCTARRFRIFKRERVEIFCAFRGGPVERAGAHFIGVVVFGPEESSAVGAEQPFVSGANYEVGAELCDIQRDASTTLADVEQE